MKIEKLFIQNFKGINSFDIDSLSDIVVIVGQNGVGKSTLFDALRLLKSSYGGYKNDEFQNYFNEFQLQVKDPSTLNLLLREKDKTLIIEVTFKLSDDEILYLKNNSEKVVSDYLNKVYSNTSNIGPFNSTGLVSVAGNSRRNRSNYAEDSIKIIQDLNQKLATKTVTGRIEISKDQAIKIYDNLTLELLFTTYNPDNIGVIEYHSAHREYQRENYNNLSVSFNDPTDQRSSHALYNSRNKYTNIKSEMASSYFRGLIAKESGAGDSILRGLDESLKLLFNTFFIGKNFKGITPTLEGALRFPVEIANQIEHDINDLSSGEKELLFGYLRLRNQSPRNSIIMIDEPELHLNPRLARKLPEFYHRTISKLHGNQMWLVTHSDAILKEIVGLPGFSIFHMADSLTTGGANQASKISVKEDLEAVLIDLIGEISSFRHGKKVVVFEGSNSEFDKYMCNSLFPEFESNINAISAGSKTNVINVQNILFKAASEGIIDKHFFSITDRDNKVFPQAKTNELNYLWDRYHIENYLLEGNFILEVLKDLGPDYSGPKSIEAINSALFEIAERLIDDHVDHSIRMYISAETRKCINFEETKDYESLQDSYFKGVEKSIEQLKQASLDSLSKLSIQKKVEEVRAHFVSSLKDDTWKKEFQGRKLISLFVGKYIQGIRSNIFKNLIIAKMKQSEFKPLGMKVVIDKILAYDEGVSF